MLTNVSCRLLRCSRPVRHAVKTRMSDSSPCCRMFRAPVRHKSDHEYKESESTKLVKVDPKEIFQKEFPEYFNEGKLVTRISYVEFIEQAMEKMKELGIANDLNAYKELLKVFPPGKYAKKSKFDIGLFSAPQQIVAIRLLTMMELNQVRPDKDVEKLVVEAFSVHSEVWLKIVRMNFWTMKSRGMDPFPIEKLPKQTYQLAKLAFTRLVNDPRSIISVTNTSSVEDVVDKTWVVYCQSSVQKAIIDRLNNKSILYIENCGTIWVKDKPLTYFALKCPADEETLKKHRSDLEPDFNYNTLKMQFYGKPVCEKLKTFENTHLIDDGYVLSLAMTGTSSHDSILSWLKILQKRNPKLKDVNVVFRLNRSVDDELEAVQVWD